MKHNALLRVERAIFCLVILLISVAGCSKTPSAGAQPRANAPTPKAVTSETVKQETVHRAVDVVGTLGALDEVTVSSEVDGAVSKILADLGDRVKAGQVMVELDREKLQYNLDQQKAAYASALAKYGGTDVSQLPAIEQTPDVQKAKAELVQAQQEYSRVKNMKDKGLVPLQQFEVAEAMLNSKKASYDAALLNAKNLRAFIDESDASMKLADRQVRDTYIRAPFDGFVSKRLVSIGQLVKAPTPVMVVVRVDPLRLTGEIPEHMAPWIRAGQPVSLSVDAYPDKNFTGNLSRISPSVNTETRAFGFEALVPNDGAILKPGTFARVHIATAKIEDVMTLPYKAIQYRYGVNRVYLVNGDHATEREVKIGDRLGDRVEIVSGLKPGENVVLTDVDNLSDGLKIAVNQKTE